MKIKIFFSFPDRINIPNVPEALRAYLEKDITEAEILKIKIENGKISRA